MLANVHFISGLPRSGSTLLAAILRQNPKFHAEMTGPVAPICEAVHQKIAGSAEFSVLFNDQRCLQMLRGIFDIYYANVAADSVVFDTNRTWTAHAALVAQLFPNCRIICCVREIGWILDSLESMRLKNPLKLSKLFSQQLGGTIYTRVDELMHSEKGLVGGAWSRLREAWFSASASRLLIVPYDILVSAPAETMQRLYSELNEPYYPHDFSNVVYEAPQYDIALGMPGLHTVGRTVEFRKRTPVIPPEIFSKYVKSQFWNNAKVNLQGATVVDLENLNERIVCSA